MSTTSPSIETAQSGPSVAGGQRPQGIRFAGVLNAVLVLGILVSAVLYGGVDEINRLRFSVFLGLLSLVWAASVATGRLRVNSHGLLELVPSLILFGLVLSWMGLQVASFVPASWHHPTWGVASEALGIDLEGRISLAPVAGSKGILWFTGYAAVFFLAYQLSEDRRNAMLGLRVFAIGQFALAAYGLFVFAGGNSTVLGIEKYAYLDSLTSTFVNRNSYATFAGLGILTAIFLLYDGVKGRLSRRLNWRERLTAVISVIFEKRILSLTGLIVLIMALVLTASRAGSAAAALGAFAFLAIYSVRRRVSPVQFAVAGSVIAAVFLGLIGLIGGQLEGRYEVGGTLESGLERLEIYKQTWVAIQEGPFFGTGYGSFQQAYYPYHNLATTSLASLQRAHNTYLENLMELGWLGMGLLALCLALILRQVVLGIFRRKETYLFAVLALSASVLVLSHALVDFSLQIPAVTASYMYLLGVAFAHSFKRYR